MGVTVIIPTINDPHLERTLQTVSKNACGDVAFVIINDGGEPIPKLNVDCEYKIISHGRCQGRRVSINEAARMANRHYLFILDAHCSMSEGWDLKMAESCTGNNLVHCVIRDMDATTWEYKGGDYLHVYLNAHYTEKWWPKKTLAQCDIEEENMTPLRRGFILVVLFFADRLGTAARAAPSPVQPLGAA